MILKMTIKLGYSNSRTFFGLGNGFFNYLVDNKILENDFEDIIITYEDCICILKDDDNLRAYEGLENGVYNTTLSYKNNTIEKIGNLKKTMEYLKKINLLFSNDDITQIRIRKEKGAELL